MISLMTSIVSAANPSVDILEYCTTFELLSVCRYMFINLRGCVAR